MTHEEIMAMPIENVKEYESVDGSSISISFDLNRIHCWLGIDFSKDNGYSAGGISYGRTILCPYCKLNETFCPKLKAHKTTLFERVVQSNSIRLNWLYREINI